MAQKHEAHPKHSEQEFIIAAIAGLGLTLGILAGMFAAFGANDSLFGLDFNTIFFSGLFLVGFAFVFWMLALRPWEEFDDLKTPYYTGHHHDEEDHHHAESHESSEETEAEDLTLIEGIGEKAKQALIAAGIGTFAQLAASTEEERLAALKGAALSTELVKPATWAKQAQYIVDGDVQGFEAYKDSLKGGVVEDLQRIEGIGPKAKQALVAAGISTFAQLAASTEEERLAALQAAGLNIKLVKPATWAKQAQFIVDGDVQGFDAYKAHLVGGVEPS